MVLRRYWTRLVGVSRERTVAPAPAPFTPIDPDRVKRLAVDEAIGHLGLLVPETTPAIIAMLDDLPSQSPRGHATAYRKRGEQLGAEEKAALGLRGNAFLSRQAWGDLTEKGRLDPLAAHETVLLRATFSVLRAKTVGNAVAAGFERFEYRGLNPDCAFCCRVGAKVMAAEASILPDPACSCPTANYGLLLDVEWFEERR